MVAQGTLNPLTQVRTLAGQPEIRYKMRLLVCWATKSTLLLRAQSNNYLGTTTCF